MSTEHEPGRIPPSRFEVPAQPQRNVTGNAAPQRTRPSVSQNRRAYSAPTHRADRTNPQASPASKPASTMPGSAPKQTDAPQGYTPLWDESRAISPRISRRLFIGGGIVAAVGIGLLGFSAFRKAMPITVSFNGTPLEIKGERTLQTAIDMSGADIAPGNLVDIAGETITEGGGTPFTATINGDVAADASSPVADGDVVAVSDGADVEEDSTIEEKTVPPQPVDQGNGPIHAVTVPGTEGLSVVKTGQTSGKEITIEVKVQGEDRIYRRAYPDTGGEKVIALTFDDGPWKDHTAAILDVLKEYDAKATFFTVGNRITGDEAALVKREYDEGHQVCTHSWSHASGSGKSVDLGLMSVEEQRAEIEQGKQAIADATGHEASTVMRAPGGNFSLDVWRNVEDLITADIGWDIDTLDWKRPGVGAIVSQLKSATPGDIILMHDGGGDRSQTAEALKKALPYLKDQGFSFITIDRMMEYPIKEI